VPAVGRDWFPPDSYVTRLVEGSTTMLADAESSTSGKLEAGPSTRVFKQDLMTRADGVSQLNRAAKVTWIGETGVVSLAVSAGTVPGDVAATLRFALATASVDAADPVPSVTVELVDGARRTAAVPLEAYGGVFPPMPPSLYKSREVARLAMLDEAIPTGAETHLQTFALPLAAFTATSPGLDPSRLREIRFRFAGPAGDGIFLDEIGIDPS
jgi:hypothetical protein